MLDTMLDRKRSQLPHDKRCLSFMRNEQGSIVTIFALVLVPLLLMAGMAIDYSRAYRGKVAVAKTLDAGLLYVASLYSSDNTVDVEEELKDYFTRTFAPRDVENLVITATVSADGNDFSGNAAGKVPTTLMRLAHFDKVAFNMNAKVSMPKMEVALVLDNTGSMQWPDPSKIVALRAAAHDLVSELMTSTPSEKMKIGLVPYAKFVNIGTSMQGESWLQAPGSGFSSWNGCVGSRISPLDIEDNNYGTKIPAIKETHSYNCPDAAIQKLTKHKGVIDTGINAMVGSGFTYIPSGLMWGWRLLSQQAPFTEGSAPSGNVTKAIILMTDGENTILPGSPQQSCYSGSWQTSCASGAADTVTKNLCDNIKAEGIVIYTVAFKAPAGAQSMMQYCASTSANYYDATNSAALKLAFKNIAKSLQRLRVTG